MKEFEIVCTYLNDCAGAAHPTRTFEEVKISNPDDYIRTKHGEDCDRFVKEIKEGGQLIYTFKNGTVTYIYEFTEI